MKSILFCLLTVCILSPITVSAAQKETDQTKIYIFNENKEIISSFEPFDNEYRGSMDIDVADLGTDGISEIIVGAGVGLPPSVSVFRQDGTKILDFYAYAQTFTGGINVASCDLTNNGQKEIITGAGITGGPHVRIFDNQGNLIAQFFAYDKNFRGGVDVTCGDTNGDGINEIITGAGITGGPHIKTFDLNGVMIDEIFAGGGQFDNFGARIASGDMDGDGDDDIFVTRAGYDTPLITYLESKNGKLNFTDNTELFSKYNNYKSGTNISTFDKNNDGISEIETSMRGGNQSVSYLISPAKSKTETYQFFTDNRDRGIIVDAITDDINNIFYVVGTTEPMVAGDETDQYILVDITDQTLRAFQNHALVKSFLVSTGINNYPSPIGKTIITDKFLWHNYSWYFGEGDPRNYSLPDVKYNLRFKTQYYLHYAYWHNNFGNRMSHGCVNINYENSEWIFNWANLGAVVEIVN